MPTTVKRQAAEDAARVLDSVWLSEGRDLPVDPYLVADRLGIDVLEADLSRNVSAALLKEHGQDPQIVLNAADHPNRKRFSCAHELGHFARRGSDPDVYEYVDFRDIFSAQGDDPDEVYANEFAACLLMPEGEVRRLHREGWTEIDMPVRFGVSRDAMHYRLKNLGLA